jgi:tRNA nucleotidyltransferase (CCA-adding enzyme)
MLRSSNPEQWMALDAIDTILRSPAAAAIAAAAGPTPAYLVGGAVRDLLDGREPAELDIALEGELEPVLEALGGEARSHVRFGTASLRVEGVAVDLARTRRERYPEPGALPVVEPAPIRSDLARRDFTVNAMAVPLRGDPELIDPYDGRADLEARLLRVIHGRSFEDDPTRALRAARYCARLDLAPDPETERLLRNADLETVSSDRVQAELRRIAAEPDPGRALRLLGEWGLLELSERRLRLAGAARQALGAAPWAGVVDPGDVVFAALRLSEDELDIAAQLAAARPESPSAGYELAGRYDDETLAIARLEGGEWLDEHLARRDTGLEIDGADLIAAGIEQGPLIGAGLRAALHARLDGKIAAGPEAELQAALAAIRPSAGHG